MIDVRFPEPAFRIRKTDEQQLIFDSMRRRWVTLTEEEWVRQNFLAYLVLILKYPASLIAVEKEIQLFDLKKRFDILVYDAGHRPWMLVECKAPAINLGEETLLQALRYNVSLPAAYLVVTNGGQTRGWHRHEKQLCEIDELPAFP